MRYDLFLHRDKIAFDAIISGKKQTEIRLFDNKRQKIQLGWIIKGALRDDETRYFFSKVIGLSRFACFDDLYRILDVKDFEKKLLSKVYSKEKELKYGVLVIHFELLETHI